jgi:hypothetical protein
MPVRRKFNYDQLDAAENMWFQRELEGFLPELYNTKYPQLKAREMLPVSYATGPGTKLITYRSYTLVGMFQAISNYASDAPRSDAFGQEFTSKVRDYGGSWGWNIREIQAAAQAERGKLGPIMPLETARAQACRRAAEVNLDQIAFGGDAEFGIIGLNNIPNSNTYVSTTGVWSAATADNVLSDLFAMEGTPLNNTNEVEFATRLLLPPAQYRLASRMRVSTVSDTTVLEFFRTQAQWIDDIQPWWRLKGAGAAGKDRALSYRPSLDTIRLEIPEEFNTLPPEPRNFEFVVNAIMAIGGVICPYPMSVTYLDGI